MVLYEKNHCIWKIKHFLNARTRSLPFKQLKARGMLLTQQRCGLSETVGNGPGGDWWMVLLCVCCFVLCVLFLFSFEPLTETELHKLSGDLPGKQKEAVSCTSPGI